MSLPQQKFRELVFLWLYSMDMSHLFQETTVSLLMEELCVTKKAVRLAQTKAEKIFNQSAEIDQLIAEASHSYAFERIQIVERNLLRLALYEILFDNTLPEKVAIAEALRLTKKFSSKASCAFVNAILDHIYQKKQGNPTETSTLTAALKELKIDEEIAHEASICLKHSEKQTPE